MAVACAHTTPDVLHPTSAILPSWRRFRMAEVVSVDHPTSSPSRASTGSDRSTKSYQLRRMILHHGPRLSRKGR